MCNTTLSKDDDTDLITRTTESAGLELIEKSFSRLLTDAADAQANSMQNVSGKTDKSLYLSNKEIDTFFSLRTANFYDVKKHADELVKQAGQGCSNGDFFKAFNEISLQITTCREQMVLNRMRSIENASLGFGLVLYRDWKDKRASAVENSQGLVSLWNVLQRFYLQKNGYRSINQVIKANKWVEMMGYITEEGFPGYEKVDKVNLLTLDAAGWETLQKQSVSVPLSQAQSAFNDEACRRVLGAMSQAHPSGHKLHDLIVESAVRCS